MVDVWEFFPLSGNSWFCCEVAFVFSSHFEYEKIRVSVLSILSVTWPITCSFTIQHFKNGPRYLHLLRETQVCVPRLCPPYNTQSPQICKFFSKNSLGKILEWGQLLRKSPSFLIFFNYELYSKIYLIFKFHTKKISQLERSCHSLLSMRQNYILISTHLLRFSETSRKIG